MQQLSQDLGIFMLCFSFHLDYLAQSSPKEIGLIISNYFPSNLCSMHVCGKLIPRQKHLSKLKEIGLRSQYMLTILGSIVDTVLEGEGHMTSERAREYSL